MGDRGSSDRSGQGCSAFRKAVKIAFLLKLRAAAEHLVYMLCWLAPGGME